MSFLGIAIKHPVPDRVKPSFVIFDIRRRKICTMRLAVLAQWQRVANRRTELLYYYRVVHSRLNANTR